jgi:hypothetical protein
MKQAAPTNSSREALTIGKTAIAEDARVIGIDLAQNIWFRSLQVAFYHFRSGPDILGQVNAVRGIVSDFAEARR